MSEKTDEARLAEMLDKVVSSTKEIDNIFICYSTKEMTKGGMYLAQHCTNGFLLEILQMVEDRYPECFEVFLLTKLKDVIKEMQPSQDSDDVEKLKKIKGHLDG